MTKRKSTKKYYFSVEGQTEQRYLSWLQKKINLEKNSAYNVSFDCQVQKNPLKRAKSLVVTSKIEIWHISDYESNELTNFKKVIDDMKRANLLGKQISYKFGYCNLTFELWLVLHKDDCNGHISDRKSYRLHLNKAYNKNFDSICEYKTQENFERCLKGLQLSDVIDAIKRAKNIMMNNEKNGYKAQKYKGYEYYTENPSLAVWEIIEKNI